MKIPKLFFQTLSERVIWMSALVLSFSLYAVVLLYFKVDQPDLKLHIGFSNQIIDRHLFPVHPIFFGLIQVLSGFSKNYNWQLFAAFLIFGAAQFFKITLSLKVVQELFDVKPSVLLFLFVLILQVAIPIPFFSENFMIKSLSMNYFHNGTLQVATPFSLALMLNLIRYFKKEEVRYFRYAVYFGLLNCLAKPSFIFCLAPVLPFVALFFLGLSPKLLKFIQLSTLLVVFILLQSSYLHSSQAAELVTFKVKFQPFFLYGTLQNHLRVVFEGFFVGLLVLVAYWRRIVANFFLLSALGFVVLGYFIAFTFVDYIDGVISPNFTWQASIVNYVFVLLSLGLFIPTLDRPKLTFPAVVCMTALSVHGLCGLLYLKMACLLRIFYLSM